MWNWLRSKSFSIELLQFEDNNILEIYHGRKGNSYYSINLNREVNLIFSLHSFIGVYISL